MSDDKVGFTDGEVLVHPVIQQMRSDLTEWARKPGRAEWPWIGSDNGTGGTILNIMVTRPGLWSTVDSDGGDRCRECNAALTYGSMIACLDDYMGSSWSLCPECGADNFTPYARMREFVSATGAGMGV